MDYLELVDKFSYKSRKTRRHLIPPQLTLRTPLPPVLLPLCFGPLGVYLLSYINGKTVKKRKH